MPFEVGKRVRAVSTAQGMQAGKVYRVSGESAQHTPFGSFYTHELHDEDTGKKFNVGNLHLLATEHDAGSYKEPPMRAKDISEERRRVSKLKASASVQPSAPSVIQPAHAGKLAAFRDQPGSAAPAVPAKAAAGAAARRQKGEGKTMLQSKSGRSYFLTPGGHRRYID